MKKILIMHIILLIWGNMLQANAGVKVVQISGIVKVRPGVEEKWHRAETGQILEEIDTIMTGENGRVVLQLQNGKKFTLYPNAMVDILDLRTITEKELFLFLMSKKVERIEPRKEKTRLKVGNVSVVHGESKSVQNTDESASDESERRSKEQNGAKALYRQEFYPNTIVKLHKILDKYPDIKDCGETYFYLGKSFEALKKPGQALDAYEQAVERHEAQQCQSEWLHDVKIAIKKLRQQ